FAGLLLQVVELLFGTGDGLLLLGGFVVVMALSVGPGFWIAQLISGVCVICCLPQFPFTRSNVELVFQLCNLVFLLLHILFDLVGCFCLVLSRWRCTGAGGRARSRCLAL